MSVPDLINGIFESCGTFFILLSCIRLYKDKKVRGVSFVHAGFFSAWGYWNLFYYPHLGQIISFIGGIGVVTMNTIWLCQMFYYIRKEKLSKGVR